MPRVRGIVFKVLWIWLRKPIPHTSWNCFHGAVELARETNSMVPWNWIAHFKQHHHCHHQYHHHGHEQNTKFEKHTIIFVCTLVSNCIIDRWQCIIPLSSSSPSSSSAVAVRRRRRCHQHHPHRHYHHHNLLLSCIPRIRNFSSNTSSRPLSVHRAMLQVSTCPQGWKWGACN